MNVQLSDEGLFVHNTIIKELLYELDRLVRGNY